MERHQRNDSDISNSYSVLDYYDNETLSVSEIGSSFTFDNSAVGSGRNSAGAYEESFFLLLNSTKSHKEPQTFGETGPETAAEHSRNGRNYASNSSNALHQNISSGAGAFPLSKLPSTVNRTSMRHHLPPMIEPLTEQRLKKSLDDRFDIYGFKKNSTLFNSTYEDYNSWYSDYIPHYLSQKKKWLVAMKANGLSVHNLDSPQRFPPKSEKIKKLVRRGIPPEWRGTAWFFYAGGHEKLNKNIGVYEKIVADTRSVQNKDTEVIERDLHRTFPDNKYFKPELLEGSEIDVSHQDRPEPPLISCLRRVLVAFAHYRPQTGYCQSLNFLVGLLLLFMSEERAFWMLVIITDRIIPQVHSANLEGVHTDQGVLMICIHEYIPKLWSIIGKNYDGTILKDDKILTRPPPLTLVTSAWFMSMFVGILPIETVLRFWDIIFYEGSKTLFRLSLTICRLCMDHPAFIGGRDNRNLDEQENDRIEIFQFIQNFPKSITDPSLLINLCFKKIGGYGFGFLSQDEINRCRVFVAQQRNRLRVKKTSLASVDLSDLEREALKGAVLRLEDEIHDVYGFHKSIMSGVAWNMHISSVMKKKLAKRTI